MNVDDFLENKRFAELFPDFPEKFHFNDFYVSGHKVLATHAFPNHGLWYSYFLDVLAELGEEHMQLFIECKFDIPLFLKKAKVATISQ